MAVLSRPRARRTKHAAWLGLQEPERSAADVMPVRLIVGPGSAVHSFTVSDHAIPGKEGPAFASVQELTLPSASPPTGAAHQFPHRTK
jgi:hypothetical protein